MKSEIRVMKKGHDITDEEIERYKSFDALLSAYRNQRSNHDSKRWYGVAFVAFVILGTGAYLVYSHFTHYPEKMMSTPVVIKDSTEKKAITTQDEMQAQDSQKESKSSEERKVVEKKSDKKSKRDEQLNVITDQVYLQAKPIAGYEDLYAYFNRELIYPADGLRDSIQGVLTVVFIINKEGKPKSITVESGLGKSFENEAIRLIENMPPWAPATLNNVPVSSKMSLPLTFQIWQLKRYDH